jgi:hypothetical protein
LIEVQMTTKTQTVVPRALKTWFVIHFLTDMLFAIPLMLAPGWILGQFGWSSIDPYTARLVSAALFGIGIESFLARDASLEIYRIMLNLKVIWSLAAVTGISLSLIQNAQARPWFAWVIFTIFLGFNFVWVYWRTRLK